LTRLQPLRTSASSLRGSRQCCRSANPLDTVQLHSYMDGMATPSGPHLCYALAARKSDRHLSRLYDSHLAPAGLSVSQFSILGLLKEHGRRKITELADMLIMERTSLVRALKPLQAPGGSLLSALEMVAPSTSRCPHRDWRKSLRQCRSGQRRRLLSKVKSDVTAPSGSATRSWN
jgi:hypothetical protein